jgi:hypothetical protein
VSDGAARHNESGHQHQEAAERHEEAAGRWDERAEPELAGSSAVLPDWSMRRRCSRRSVLSWSGGRRSRPRIVRPWSRSASRDWRSVKGRRCARACDGEARVDGFPGVSTTSACDGR